MMRKKIILISMLSLLLILLGIGVSYSMWIMTVSQTSENIAYSKCFDLSISNQENDIKLENAYPISNDRGKSLTPFTFKVTNTCDITAQYSINLEVLKDSTLPSNFIDVMFEGNINLLNSYDITDKVNTSSIESRKLTTGILKSKESKDYSLRLWIDYDTTMEDLDNETKSFKSKIVVVGKPINYTGDTVFNFDYTGAEQTFVAPVSGTYKLETWGAQGGDWGNANNHSTGGYGGYATGTIHLIKAGKSYIKVGKSCENSTNGVGGGGATYILNKSEFLKKLEKELSSIIIVSGGGGGSEWPGGSGGSGGGFKGNDGNVGTLIVNENYTMVSISPPAKGGSQNFGGLSTKIDNKSKTTNIYNGSFGTGGYTVGGDGGGQGGNGYYGGGASDLAGGGGGGSGYIGNPLIKDKVMYCYNCEESNEENTKTISTTCSEETPISNCAKKGNGYARITLISIDE